MNTKKAFLGAVILSASFNVAVYAEQSRFQITNNAIAKGSSDNGAVTISGNGEQSSFSQGPNSYTDANITNLFSIIPVAEGTNEYEYLVLLQDWLDSEAYLNPETPWLRPAGESMLQYIETFRYLVKTDFTNGLESSIQAKLNALDLGNDYSNEIAQLVNQKDTGRTVRHNWGGKQPGFKYLDKQYRVALNAGVGSEAQMRDLTNQWASLALDGWLVERVENDTSGGNLNINSNSQTKSESIINVRFFRQTSQDDAND